MLSIAEKVGYSETAFVVRNGTNASFGIRFFSPRAEVAFCGHATVAAAVALAERQGPGRLELSSVAGPIVVDTVATEGAITATLRSPPTRTRPVAPPTLAQALAALRWRSDDLDPAFPAHVAYAGNDHPMLAAASLERLGALDYDFDALGALMAREGWTTMCLFCPDAEPGTFQVRNPFPPGGVVEDPATGAAAAAFGGYLRSTGLVVPPARLTLLQGQQMGRPSRLVVDVLADSEQVLVTGAATRLELAPGDEAHLSVP
jgi:PhzF family phenazine biosynthesis protein